MHPKMHRTFPTIKASFFLQGVPTRPTVKTTVLASPKDRSKQPLLSPHKPFYAPLCAPQPSCVMHLQAALREAANDTR